MDRERGPKRGGGLRRPDQVGVRWTSLAFAGCVVALAIVAGVPYLWAVELTLVAVLAGYARRLFGQQARAMSATLEQVNQLSEANELLVSLHRVVQTLPASLNLDEAVSSTMARLRELIECDVAALLLRDDTGRWTPGWAEGTVVGAFSEDAQLPSALATALGGSCASLVVSLGAGEGLGDPTTARCGLYAPLRARGALVGLLALEHRQPGRYGRRELRLLDGFMEPAALAIDNARWFGRLRTMGADEERNRIARDMHDRVGQSLAYVAFTLERISGQADPSLRGVLAELRSEVRGVLADVRETLSDLRTDVSDRRGFAATLRTFLERVAARSGVEVDFVATEDRRLPLLQERELWRIAQEAVVNVERHSGARHLSVRWDCDGATATLVVADDGRGFDADDPGRSDAYGICGMRERAGAVGARLLIASERHAGTVVECVLGPSSAAFNRRDPGDRAVSGGLMRAAYNGAGPEAA